MLPEPHRSVLIFGGTGGIGRVVAKAFATSGFGVTVAARRSSRLEGAVRALSPLPVSGCIADIADCDQVAAARDFHLDRFQHLDVIVNAAAIQGPIGEVWENDPHHWQATVVTNLVGSFHVCRTALPSMLEAGRGTLILLSGGGAAYARPRFSAYGASKTGVLRLVESVHEEIGKRASAGSAMPGVRIYAIAPGAVYTPMTDEVLADRRQSGEAAYLEALQTKTDGGTPPERAAELCLFLAALQPLSLSGKLIHVNEPYREYVRRMEDQPHSRTECGLLRRVSYKDA